MEGIIRSGSQPFFPLADANFKFSSLRLHLHQVFIVKSDMVHQVIVSCDFCSSELIRHIACHLQFPPGGLWWICPCWAKRSPFHIDCRVLGRNSSADTGMEDRGSIARRRPACIHTLDAAGTLLQLLPPHPPPLRPPRKSEGPCFLIDASVHFWWALSIGHTAPRSAASPVTLQSSNDSLGNPKSNNNQETAEQIV